MKYVVMYYRRTRPLIQLRQCGKILIFLLFLALLLVPTASEQRNEFTLLKISPNSSFVVARGQTLKLNVTLNETDGRYTDISKMVWSFRCLCSTFFNVLAEGYLFDVADTMFYKDSYDPRASIIDDFGTLLVENTTLYDSGTYWCNVTLGDRRKKLCFQFDVIIEDEPKAEISCSQTIELTEGESFSCWCQAVGYNMVPTASWVKNGHVLGNTSSPRTELSLRNVKKDVAGTYICRARLHSLTDEKSTEIVVYYRPSISSFESQTFKNNSLKLSCVSYGVPPPNNTVLSYDGTVLAEINNANGVVIIQNYSSSLNVSYTCIANNKLGQDKRRLFVEQDDLLISGRPRIIFFESKTFKNNSIKLICVACGEPQPSYTVLNYDGTVLEEINNGVVIIPNYSSWYTCIAENKLGRVNRRLFVDHEYDDILISDNYQGTKGYTIMWILVSLFLGILLGVCFTLAAVRCCAFYRKRKETQASYRNESEETEASEFPDHNYGYRRAILFSELKGKLVIR